MTATEREPATFRLVALCLNRLRAPQHLYYVVMLNTKPCLDNVHPVQYNKLIIIKNELFEHKNMFNLKINEVGFI